MLINCKVTQISNYFLNRINLQCIVELSLFDNYDIGIKSCLMRTY